jgi:E3 ubiquitin-protein ligase RGLG
MVSGIEGVLGIYRQSLPHIKLSGPTYFGEVLEKFKAHCQKQAGKTNWNVLLIITDGTIHDFDKTKSLLVELSGMPASVIIVAVGDDDFEGMYELDGDKSKLVDANG